MNKQLRIFVILAATFLFAYFVPFGNPRVSAAIGEAFAMLQEYAREHVLLCLVPAFFIAGAIAVFIKQGSVIKYLGSSARKAVAYTVASVSGAVLAVCSCTVLPLFAGIYKRGAGLGPAVAFLYSGPAINVLAIILTARVLGVEFGIARAIGAVLFAILIGLAMHFLFRHEEQTREQQAAAVAPQEPPEARPLWKTAAFVAVMIGFLVFVNWGKPGSISVRTSAGTMVTGIRVGQTATELSVRPTGMDEVVTIPTDELAERSYTPSAYTTIYESRFYIALGFLAVLLVMLLRWFRRPEIKEWGASSWTYAKLILPYLFGGVLLAGFLLGRPGHAALIPESWISGLVGGNSWAANAIASVSGALMYFATLTELPILQGLQGAGMGDGPALALLLAGPALSLPNMLVIRKVLGTKKTLAYVALVCIAATLSGKLFGVIVG